jgi:hypothetical protein
MKTTLRALNYGFLATICLTAAMTLAPQPAAAGSCLCSGRTTPVDADTQQACDTMCGATGAFTPTAPSGATSPGGTVTASPLENPLAICPKGTSGQKCVQLVIGNVIRAALGIVGSIALIMMVWGGFLWLTSMGSSDKVEKGKNTLIWATLGLVVIFGAYALTNFIITSIAGGGK